MVKSPLFTLWILSGFNLKGVRNCSSFLRLLSLLKIARLTGCLKYHLWSLFSSQFVIKMFHGVTANVLWKGSIGSRVTCRSALLGCEYALSSEFAMTLRNIFVLPGKKLFERPFWLNFEGDCGRSFLSKCRVGFETAEVPWAQRYLTRKEKTSKNALQRELSTALQANVLDRE